MKKIINRANDVVEEALEGLVLSHPGLALNRELAVVCKKEKSGRVGIVSGGGSGHEPAHAGYVGDGMLDAAVAGNVFASPSPDRILEGIRRADSGKGVLLIIKNYSGDIMNFSMAEDLAELAGIRTAHVIVRDDVAVEESTYSTGRRGIAGTVFVHKIAGAMAAAGAGLAEIKSVCEQALEGIRTMGMSMSSCTLPAVGHPGFALGEDEVEIGMGIHGEPGIERCGMMPAAELAELLTGKIFADRAYDGETVALMVNGLGATPQMELLILNREVRRVLDRHNIRVDFSLVGNYMTSLDMAGASVTLFALNDQLRPLLLAPCDTPALKVRGAR